MTAIKGDFVGTEGISGNQSFGRGVSYGVGEPPLAATPQSRAMGNSPLDLPSAELLNSYSTVILDALAAVGEFSIERRVGGTGNVPIPDPKQLPKTGMGPLGGVTAKASGVLDAVSGVLSMLETFHIERKKWKTARKAQVEARATSPLPEPLYEKTLQQTAKTVVQLSATTAGVAGGASVATGVLASAGAAGAAAIATPVLVAIAGGMAAGYLAGKIYDWVAGS